MIRFRRPQSSSESTARRISRRAGLLAAAIVATGSLSGAQGETGFLRGAGRLDVALTYTLDTYDEFWVGSERVSMPGVGTVDRAGYSLYTAYGVNDELDLIFSGSYIEAESDGLAGAPDENDLQDMALAAKLRVLHRGWGWGEAWLALLPGVKIPLTDYENDSLTAIGDRQIDWRGRVVGHVQTNRGLFAALETGYDKRNGSPEDEVPIHLTLGGTIAGRVTIAPFFSRVDSLGGTDIGPPGTNYFPANEEDYTRVGIGAYVRITDRLGVTGNWRTTIDGRNTGDVDGFSLGLVFNFNTYGG